MRKSKVEAEAHNEREDKRAQRNAAAEGRADRVHRSGNHNMEEGETVENPADAW